MTWTEKTKQAETWAAPARDLVFSRTVFSVATYSGQTVFAVGAAGIWDGRTIQAETWTAA